MKRSIERILTTHTGSLPRPPELVPILRAKENGDPYDEAAFTSLLESAVREVVRKQVETGISVVNDGEASKYSYATYAKDRLTGFGGTSAPIGGADAADFPEYFEKIRSQRASTVVVRPACIGEVKRTPAADEAVARDIENFRTALDGVDPADAFMSAASPGVISMFLQNKYYPSHEAYVYALANAMKPEYDAIHRAGFLLQIDCPDLASLRGKEFHGQSFEEFRKVTALHVEVLNYVTRDIPADRLRMHLCWGNTEAPHHRDIPLNKIVDLILPARPAAISFEGANPRHAHEWTVWEDVKLPEGKVLLPGVLDSTTNFIEHPELVAQRIVQYAKVVGRENVIAGSDCGFATAAEYSAVDPSIVWAKLQAMVEGARIASKKLW